MRIIEDKEELGVFNIGIELRGSSSLRFPKKSYGLETRDNFGDDLSVSLFGFPEEEDWILYGPFLDNSLLRNVFMYELSNAIGRFAVELNLLN